MESCYLPHCLLEGLSPKDARARHRVEVQGDPSALDRFGRILPFPTDAGQGIEEAGSLA